MADFHFDWDPAKAISNLRRHGVSFEEAVTSFYDDNALVSADPDHSNDEDQFLLLGLTDALRFLLVAHCYREGDTVIRLISARKATRSERTQYQARRPR